jgi:DNA-directed RNA polymerase subunit RPC12/RpoP
VKVNHESVSSKLKPKLNQQSSILESSRFSGKEPLKDLSLEDSLDLERKDAYIEPLTRDLLRKLLQCCEKEEIIPFYSPSEGFVYQLLVQNGSKDVTELSIDYLENLTRLDILEKSFHDTVSVCPSCESTIITLHDRCPKCKSHNILKTSLTEHIPCGCIDQRAAYIKNRCPKCGQDLIEGQYRNMGQWYLCGDCSERFENPEFDLVCRHCNNRFTIKEAQIREIPKFRLNLNRMKEIRQNVASLESIRVLLTNLGFSIELPGIMIGQKSGMQHHFSLIGKKTINGQDIAIVLDHAVSETEVQASPLILYVYKTSELKVDIPAFVAIPKLNDVAKKIAEGNQILIVEGSTDNPEAIKYIQQEIENRILQLTVNSKQKKTEKPKTREKKSIFTKTKQRISILAVKQED